MSQIVRMQDVVKRFGKTLAVDRLSLSVDEGSVYGLVGANGAGRASACSDDAFGRSRCAERARADVKPIRLPRPMTRRAPNPALHQRPRLAPYAEAVAQMAGILQGDPGPPVPDPDLAEGLILQVLR